MTFGVSGKLIMNALVMYDHQTGSLWSQFIGQAVKGSLSGTKLEHMSSQLTTWSDWKRQFPDTQALKKGSFSSRDPYTSYYRGNRAGIIGETYTDERLLTKEFVVGLESGGTQKAYPFRHLNGTPVLNDTFQDRPVVVSFNDETGSAVVFDRNLDGETLTFDQASDPLFMTDRETGTTWSKATGEAVAGPLSGTNLEKVPSLISFWFAWKDFYPDTLLYLG